MAEIRSGPSLSPGYIIKYLIRLVSTNRIWGRTTHLVTVGSARITGGEGAVRGRGEKKIIAEGEDFYNQLEKWEKGVILCMLQEDSDINI